jgi:hypothetical protein
MKEIQKQIIAPAEQAREGEEHKLLFPLKMPFYPVAKKIEISDDLYSFEMIKNADYEIVDFDNVYLFVVFVYLFSVFIYLLYVFIYCMYLFICCIEFKFKREFKVHFEYCSRPANDLLLV